MALTLEQRLTKAHIWAMRNPNFAFLSGIMLMGKSEVRDDLPTAATDGRNKYYGRAFCEKLSQPEFRFVVLHENYHAAARHLTIYKNLMDLDAQRANMAMDHWINLSLIETDGGKNEIIMPAGGCADPKYKGWDVLRIFRDIKQNGGKGGAGGGSGFDEHMWDEANSLSPEEQRQLGREIDQALRQGGILAGKLKGQMPREIGELLEPKVNWREALADFIKEAIQGYDDAAWDRLDRKLFGAGHYYPSLISETVGKLCIAIDTSGSIGQEMLTLFATELVSICNEVIPDGVDIVWWDTHVAGVQSFGKDEFDGIDGKMKPAGGGGTDPHCVAEWLKVHEKDGHVAVILLSDGYVSGWPQFNIPALWALTTKNITADHGKTVYIDE